MAGGFRDARGLTIDLGDTVFLPQSGQMGKVTKISALPVDANPQFPQGFLDMEVTITANIRIVYPGGAVQNVIVLPKTEEEKLKAAAAAGPALVRPQ